MRRFEFFFERATVEAKNELVDRLTLAYYNKIYYNCIIIGIINLLFYDYN